MVSTDRACYEPMQCENSSDILCVGLVSLPNEVLSQIVACLADDTLSLARLGATSQAFRQLVKESSALWPSILSSLISNVQLLEDGQLARIELLSFRSPELTDMLKSPQFFFTAIECYQAAIAIRRMIPQTCFNALVTTMVRKRKHSRNNLAVQTMSHCIDPLTRLSKEYRPKLYHEEGVLAIAEDMPDVLFDLSNDDLIILRNFPPPHIQDSVCVRILMNFLLSRMDTPQVYHLLQLAERVQAQQRYVDECSTGFERAAKDRKLFMPNRRHISERFFIQQNWSIDYALGVLDQCQNKIREELREHRISTLLESANLCISPYSYLTAQFVSGGLGKTMKFSDDDALTYTFASLQELNFAYRYTPYNELKHNLLYEAGIIRNLLDQQKCLTYIQRQLPLLLDQTTDIYTGQLLILPCFPSDECFSDDFNALEGSSANEIYDPALERSWCIMEKAYEVDTWEPVLKAYEIDNRVDFEETALVVRDWLFFIFSCAFFATASFSSKDEAKLEILHSRIVPPSLSAQIIETVHELASLLLEERKYHNQLQDAVSRREFILQSIGKPGFILKVREAVACHMQL